MHTFPLRLALLAALVIPGSPAAASPPTAAPAPVPKLAAPADVAKPSPCQRHEEKVKAVKSTHHDLLLIGDSITQTLGDGTGDYAPLKAVWDKYFVPRHALNLGYSGYRTENILWNLANGELDQAESPKAVTLLIGTNNTDDQHYPAIHTARELFAGTKAIVEMIRQRHPTTKILVLRPFPCGGPDEKPDPVTGRAVYHRSAKALAALREAGELTRQLADGKHVFWLDIGHVFLRADGSINPELMPDRIHPNTAGAEAWARAILPTLDAMMAGTTVPGH